MDSKARDAPGRPPEWRGSLVEVDRVETEDPAELLSFLQAHGLAGEPALQRGDVGAAVLLGARGCARVGGVPEPIPSPTAVPECVAVAYRRTEDRRESPIGSGRVGSWAASWSEAEHRAAIEEVQRAIARGEVYQANVVGHRSAPFTGDPRAVSRALGILAGAGYGGSLSGSSWLVASASPEQLVWVNGDHVETKPIKGTAGSREALLASEKDRAEHIMIVDLERNDLARVTRAGSVTTHGLYEVTAWADVWHAATTVSGELAAGTTVAEVLRAVLPGGSVTGAPKQAACDLLQRLEPVGRGPSMGALGFVWPGGLDLGLTIRTVAVADDRIHLWTGGGITWGSDPVAEVAEAAMKAAPLVQALSDTGRVGGRRASGDGSRVG